MLGGAGEHRWRISEGNVEQQHKRHIIVDGAASSKAPYRVRSLSWPHFWAAFRWAGTWPEDVHPRRWKAVHTRGTVLIMMRCLVSRVHAHCRRCWPLFVAFEGIPAPACALPSPVLPAVLCRSENLAQTHILRRPAAACLLLLRHFADTGGWLAGELPAG